ncbi:MAG TPA: hypothetical protein PLB89_18170, partial [Flavobacteriales bacterium]|nr:hypothetical protein [Flavobacteriales bacterium]
HGGHLRDQRCGEDGREHETTEFCAQPCSTTLPLVLARRRMGNRRLVTGINDRIDRGLRVGQPRREPNR